MYILSQILGWLATIFRAGGMLAKKPMQVKILVSVGNLGWMLSGILTANITFESGIQGNEGVTYEKEYIYNGAFDMSERKSSAPTKNLSRAPKFQK